MRTRVYLALIPRSKTVDVLVGVVEGINSWVTVLAVLLFVKRCVDEVCMTILRLPSRSRSHAQNTLRLRRRRYAAAGPPRADRFSARLRINKLGRAKFMGCDSQHRSLPISV